MPRLRSPLLLSPLALVLTGPSAQAQPVAASPASSWQTCAAQNGDDAARLRCFDTWARQQSPAAATVNTQETPAQAPPPNSTATATVLAQAAQDRAETPVVEPCHNTRYTALSRFWELESDTNCGIFGLRGYRPISLSLAQSSGVNRTPGTPNPENQATGTNGYQRSETRIQLSVRTKVAQGLLTPEGSQRLDSLWVGYSQQSFWQVFSANLSRPFRATDHEPELIYVYPTYAELGSWRLRYTGLGLVHQSNGQSLPFSRSWNRVYLMAGMESKDERFRLTGRIWHRFREDAKSDDNPDIVDYIGRAEITAGWTFSTRDQLNLTLRTPLKTNGKGSTRLEWMRALGPQDGGWQRSGLRFYTQLFHGYGDSLIDYNVRRTVFSVGLSLMDF